MIRLLTVVLLFASFNAAAEVTLTDINNNEVADADEVMGNFNALKNEIESLPLPPSDCLADQIIKWSGSAWVCAPDPINLNCEEGDLLQYTSDSWSCRSGYEVRGTISGLQGEATLSLNGVSLVVSENGEFVFDNKVHGGNIAYTQVVGMNSDTEACAVDDGNDALLVTRNISADEISVRCNPQAILKTAQYNWADIDPNYTVGDRYEDVTSNVDATQPCKTCGTGGLCGACHIVMSNVSDHRTCEISAKELQADSSLDTGVEKTCFETNCADSVSVFYFKDTGGTVGSAQPRELTITCDP